METVVDTVNLGTPIAYRSAGSGRPVVFEDSATEISAALLDWIPTV